MSPEMQAQIQLWRQKARDGTLSQDEMREAIKALRQDRIPAANASAKSRATKSKAKTPVNSDDLLNDLENL